MNPKCTECSSIYIPTEIIYKLFIVKFKKKVLDLVMVFAYNLTVLNIPYEIKQRG